MTKSKLMKIFYAYYDSDFGKVLPENRRFLIMKTICFLGAKRFNDIQKLRRSCKSWGRFDDDVRFLQMLRLIWGVSIFRWIGG